MEDEVKIGRKRGLLAKAEGEVESSLERARRRAAELKGHIDGVEDSTDEFFVPPEIVPDGWTYEWKRRMVFNKEDPSYAVQLSREGWEAVPLNRCKRHRAMMPQGWDGETIERHGMQLMERPAEITQEYRNIEIRRARAQVRQKEEQLSTTPDGTLSRNDPRVSPKIKKSYSPVEIPGNE